MAGVNVLDDTGAFVASFDTIQAAIDSASTLDGCTIEVIAADYSPGAAETVNVTKEVTIATDGNGHGRIITDSPGPRTSCGVRRASGLRCLMRGEGTQD